MPLFLNKRSCVLVLDEVVERRAPSSTFDGTARPHDSKQEFYTRKCTRQPCRHSVTASQRHNTQRDYATDSCEYGAGKAC